MSSLACASSNLPLLRISAAEMIICRCRFDLMVKKPYLSFILPWWDIDVGNTKVDVVENDGEVNRKNASWLTRWILDVLVISVMTSFVIDLGCLNNCHFISLIRQILNFSCDLASQSFWQLQLIIYISVIIYQNVCALRDSYTSLPVAAPACWWILGSNTWSH